MPWAHLGPERLLQVVTDARNGVRISALPPSSRVPSGEGAGRSAPGPPSLRVETLGLSPHSARRGGKVCTALAVWSGLSLSCCGRD